MNRIVLAAVVVALAGCQKMADYVNESTEPSASRVEFVCAGVASKLANQTSDDKGEAFKGVYIKDAHALDVIDKLSKSCIDGYQSAKRNIKLTDYEKTKMAQWKEGWASLSQDEAKKLAYFQALELSAFSSGHNGYTLRYQRTLWQAISEELGMNN